MLEIGQKVVVIKSRKAKVGQTGIVAVIDEDKARDTVGVFLATEPRDGHDLDGNCPDGFGLFFAPEQLVALVD